MLLQSRLSLSRLAHVASPGSLRFAPAAAVDGAALVLTRGKATATGEHSFAPPRINPVVANKDIPGPKSYPLIGALPDFIKHNGAKRPDAYFAKLYREYGWISKLEIFGNSTVLLYHPEDIRNVYAEMGRYPSSPVFGMPALMKQLQVSKRDKINVAALDFEEWKVLRTKLQKYIATPQQAISYLPVINPISKDFSDQLKQNQGNLKEILPRYTFEVIAAVLFGKRMGAIEGADPATEKFISNALRMFLDGASFTYEFPWYQYWNTPKFKKFVENNEYLFQEGAKQVLEVMEKMKTEPEKYADTYVGRLLLAHDLTLEEMAENCGGLFAAGVDTTSNTLTWVLLHLAQFPEAQEKLHQELSSVLKGGDYDEALSSKLPYMKACFKESVRLDPVASSVLKKLETDFKTKSGHTIVAGTEIMLAGAAMFRDPKYVERPDDFVPERWFEDAKAKRVKENNPLDQLIPYYPFSFGARMCLGARLASVEMNSLIARVVQDFKVSLPANPQPYEKISMPFLQPIPFPELIFTPRN